MQVKVRYWLRGLIIGFVVTNCGLGLLISKGYGQQQEVPNEIVIDKGQYSTDIYEGVLFKHRVHALELGFTCKVCHHTWEQEENMSTSQCNSCHAAVATEIVSLRDAYMNKCRGCHSSFKIEGKVSGPTRCDGCHQKKKLMR